MNSIKMAGLLQQAANYSSYGVKTKYLSFNGTSNYVSVPHSSSFDLQTLTIEFWAYQTAAMATNDQYLGRGIAASPTEMPYRFRAAAAAEPLSFGYFVGGASRESRDTASGIHANFNTWFHYAGIIGQVGSDWWTFLYRNGVLVDSDNHGANAPPQRTTDFYIGGENNRRFFPGYLDEVRIWNTVRTEAEIKRHMNTKLTGWETGLVSRYSMDKGSGSDLPDDQKDGLNNGTITGATWVTL